MTYSEQYTPFLDDKIKFFSEVRLKESLEDKKKQFKEKVELAETLAKTKDHAFILNNHSLLETEFVQMFAILKNRKDENSDAFWAYCYYCASLLEAFHQAYSPTPQDKDKPYIAQGKEAHYKQLKEQIRDHLDAKESTTSDETFISVLEKSFIDGFQSLIKAPFHLSKLRDYVAFTNLCRLYWVFCRLTLTSAFALAKNLHLFDKINVILKTPINVDKIISIFQAPNGVLNYFSVGLFLARFIIDAGLLIRHTFFPYDNEKNSTRTERFLFELNKRKFNFANDLVWSTVNFLTNFNHITRIPNPVTGVITAAFLGFDVFLLSMRILDAKKTYLIKKAQYQKELNDYNSTLIHQLSDKERKAHLSMLERQLAEHEIEWNTKRAHLCFATSAAGLLMLGFSAALIFSPPGIVIASFFVCTLAAAMYFSADAFANYKHKSLRLDYHTSELSVSLEQCKIALGVALTGYEKDRDWAKYQIAREYALEQHKNGLKAHELALEEYKAARNEFIFKIIKNTFMPTLLIATFAICWPAAVALTVVYLGYELISAYQKHHANKPKDPFPSLPATELVIEEESVAEQELAGALTI